MNPEKRNVLIEICRVRTRVAYVDFKINWNVGVVLFVVVVVFFLFRKIV